METYEKQQDGSVKKTETTTFTNKELKALIEAEKANIQAYNDTIAYNQEQKVLCQARIDYYKTLV